MTRIRRALTLSLGLVVSSALLAGVASSAGAATLYVSNVNPVGDGSSCAQPGYDDPQAAIDASIDGDTILICAGTYPGGYDLGGSAATGDLYLEGEGIGSTIVDAGATGDEDNPRLFFDSDPGGIATVHFSDMSLRDGYAADAPGVDNGGGAIGLWLQGGGTSDLTVDTVEFQGNWAEGSGGAIRAGDVTVSSSTFTGNEARIGSGAGQDRAGAVKAEGTLEVTDSEFTQNYALDQGGAVSAEGRADIHSSNFESNRSDWDGGAVFAPSGLAVTSTEFTINVANDSGGGVWASGVVCVDYFEDGCPAAPDDYTGEGTTFRDNVTEGNNGNGRGGGLYSQSVLYMDGALLTGNSAEDIDGGDDASPDGGGLFNNGTALIIDSMVTQNTAERFGGGIDSFGSLTLVGSFVSSNSSDSDGGGIKGGGSDLELVDSTVSGNLSLTLGGGIMSEVSEPLFDGTTVSGNQSQNVGGGIFLSGSTDATILDSAFTENEAANGGGGVLADGAELTVDGSTFAGNQSGLGGDWPGGGGIASNRDLTVVDSTFDGNRATGEGAIGGAIAAPETPGAYPITVLDSTFTGNEAADFGGAIGSSELGIEAAIPNVLIEGSTFSGSDETTAAAGVGAAGVVFILGSTFTDLDAGCAPAAFGTFLALVSSTVTGNSGGAGPACEGVGGAVLAIDALGLLNTTLSGNSTTGLVSSLDQYQVSNSIIDHDGAACDLAGEGTPPAGNVVTDRTTDCNALVGGPAPSLNETVTVAELGLGPLADNGGPTETMAIGPESAAIGVGVLEVVDEGITCPEVDQRGFERSESECDSGAYQYIVYDLTVNKGGSGGGVVTSDPAGIECGSTCQYGFEPEAEVTLTAEPDRGSRFAGWSGAGCSGTGPCEVTMSQARLVNATFFSPNPGVKIARRTAGTVRVGPSNRKVGIARVTCLRETCVIKSARIVIRARGKVFRVKAAFPKARFRAGASRIVSATVPRAALRRLRAGERSGSASALVVASSPDRTRAQRQVRIGLSR